MKKLLLLSALVCGLANSIQAAELGDAAAPLRISEWVKGKAVDLAAVKGKQIVVVEFWATWCPPCRTSIPHLTDMQKKFKDVLFVGVTDEEAGVVKKFVTKMGAKMDYVVAIDDEAKTSEGYMKAFGVGGIPHAFIVDKDSRVVWQGHPMDGLERALDQIIAGKYDLEVEKGKAKQAAAAAAKQAGTQDKLQRLAQLIAAGKDDAETKQLEAELSALEQETGGLLGGEKFEPADFRKRVLFGEKVQSYQKAYLAAASPAELAKLEQELQVGAPASFNLNQFKQMLSAQAEGQKFGPLLESYMAAVGAEGDAAKAAELGKQIAAAELKSPQLLNRIAWVILTEAEVKHRDVPLALNLARRAVEASDSNEAHILDTYARALFDSGKTSEAVAQLQKALAVAEDEATKKELGVTLQKYQQKAAAKAAPGL